MGRKRNNYTQIAVPAKPPKQKIRNQENHTFEDWARWELLDVIEQNGLPYPKLSDKALLIEAMRVSRDAKLVLHYYYRGKLKEFIKEYSRIRDTALTIMAKDNK